MHKMWRSYLCTSFVFRLLERSFAGNECMVQVCRWPSPCDVENLCVFYSSISLHDSGNVVAMLLCSLARVQGLSGASTTATLRGSFLSSLFEELSGMVDSPTHHLHVQLE